MNETLDYAYKLGCGRLIFEHGAIEKLGKEAARWGKSAYILGGPRALKAVCSFVEESLQKAGVSYWIAPYSGTCSEEKANEIAAVCREKKLDLLIGIGGGKIMDLSKIAADVAGLPVINVPTIAATCAAYTPLSVVYTPEGACRGTWYLRKEVDCVLCDLDVLCSQSPRYLAAGILDAIAKHVEILHHVPQMQNAGEDTLIARQLARTSYEDLLQLGKEALDSLRQGKQSAAAERCIFHAIVTTGLVSGIARGRYQSALAHALYEAIRTLYTESSAPSLHGEVVAVGLLLQTCYYHRPDMFQELSDFMAEAGMPLTLPEIGVGCSEKELRTLAAHSPLPRFFQQPDQDADTLFHILQDHLC